MESAGTKKKDCEHCGLGCVPRFSCSETTLSFGHKMAEVLLE